MVFSLPQTISLSSTRKTLPFAVTTESNHFGHLVGRRGHHDVPQPPIFSFPPRNGTEQPENSSKLLRVTRWVRVLVVDWATSSQLRPPHLLDHAWWTSWLAESRPISSDVDLYSSRQFKLGSSSNADDEPRPASQPSWLSSLSFG